MIKKQVMKAIERMFERRTDTGAVACKASFDERIPHTMSGAHIAFQHVLYMVDYMKENDFDTPKANRWLGFIQGVLWMLGLASISEMGKINGEAMNEAALTDGWLDAGAPSAADTLLELLNISLREHDAMLPNGLSEYRFKLPFDNTERRDTAASLEEAKEYTLWRLWSQLERYIYRDETREQRIERLAEDLTKALAKTT
jgi:hypothetical protein